MQPQFIDLVTATPERPRSGEGDIALLKDGRLLLVYGEFSGIEDDDTADLLQRYSSDGGRTWSDPELLISHTEAGKNVISASLLRLQSGALLLFYLRFDDHTLCQAWVRRSDDEGRSWGEAICCTPAKLYHSTVNNCAVQCANGRVILPVSVSRQIWSQDEHFEVGTAWSDDEGRTWQQSNLVYAPVRGAMEPRVEELRDGRLWMPMRTDRGMIDQSFSLDRGETWSDPVPSGIESPQAPFVLTRIPTTGDLLLIRNPHADVQSWPMQGYRTPLRAAISSDEGATWTHEKDLESDLSQQFHYLSTTFVDDMVIFSYYVCPVEGALQSLRIARVPLGWFYE